MFIGRITCIISLWVCVMEDFPFSCIHSMMWLFWSWKCEKSQATANWLNYCNARLRHFRPECLKSVAWHIRAADCLCSSNAEHSVRKGPDWMYFMCFACRRRHHHRPYSAEWFMVKKFRFSGQSNKFIVPFSVWIFFPLHAIQTTIGCAAIYRTNRKIFFKHFVHSRNIAIHNSFIWFFLWLFQSAWHWH